MAVDGTPAPTPRILSLMNLAKAFVVSLTGLVVAIWGFHETICEKTGWTLTCSSGVDDNLTSDQLERWRKELEDLKREISK